MTEESNNRGWLDRLDAALVDGGDRRRGLYDRYRSLRNLRAVRRRRRAAGGISNEADFTIPRDMGFARFEPGRFPEINAIVYEGNRELEKLEPTRVIQPEVGTKGLFMGLFDCDRLTLDSPFMKFALRPDIVGPVSRYLGVVPVLARIDLWYSTHQPDLNRTHFYHCDWTAIQQMKVFVNCTDVGPDDGPLMIVEAAKSREIRRDLKYDYDRQGNKYYVSDEQMADRGAAEHEHRFTGSAGTVCLVDTSRCFHCGSRIAEGAGPRLVAMFQYLRPSAFRLPLKFRAGAPFRKMAREHQAPWLRMVLGAE